MRPFRLILASLLLGYAIQADPGEYPGVADPFADPSQYEFADDEKDDKEFFHLGRFFMLGIDVGANIFTGGLGASTSPGILFGGRVLYFLDKLLALEGRVHLSSHLDQPSGSDLDVAVLSYGGGLRYYFDITSAPRAIAIANPYLALGAGAYQRSFNVVSGAAPPNLQSMSFGANLGGGVEFLVYRKHVYIGLDLRYHLIFFPDEGSAMGSILRDGDIFSSALTMTYNF